MRRKRVAGRDGKAVFFTCETSITFKASWESGQIKPEARPTVDLLGTGPSCLIRTWGRKPGEGFKVFPLSLGDPAQRGHGGKLCGKPPTRSTDTQPSVRSLGWAQCIKAGGRAPGPASQLCWELVWQLGQDPSPPWVSVPPTVKGPQASCSCPVLSFEPGILMGELLEIDMVL